MGAAFATLVSHFLFALFSYMIGNTIFPVKHNLKAIAVDLSIGIILISLTKITGYLIYQRVLAFIILVLILAYKEKDRIRKVL